MRSRGSDYGIKTRSVSSGSAPILPLSPLYALAGSGVDDAMWSTTLGATCVVVFQSAEQANARVL